jgi:hypothetical protein
LNRRPALYEAGPATEPTSSPEDPAIGSPEIAPPETVAARSLPDPDPTEAELERAIVEAELGGRRTVADLLARRLESLRASRSAQVISLDARRRRGRAE